METWRDVLETWLEGTLLAGHFEQRRIELYESPLHCGVLSVAFDAGLDGVARHTGRDVPQVLSLIHI